MEKQYCRVGTVTPLKPGGSTQALLEEHYRILLQKASELQQADLRLKEFFESKAQKIKKTLEDLV